MTSGDGWREQVLVRRGSRCWHCHEMLNLQIDHVMPRSQGGETVVENGIPLCGPWSHKSKFSGGCHRAKTDHLLKLSLSKLPADTQRYLREKGWVYVDEDTGQLGGRGCRSFVR